MDKKSINIAGFQEIQLNDKDVFDHYLQQCFFPRRLITYSFSNFYMWRHWDKFTWRIEDRALCLMANYQLGPALLPPLAPNPESFLLACRHLMKQVQEQGAPIWFVALDSEMADYLQQLWPGRFCREEYRPGGNYIYRQQDLATLAGKKYDAKRNHLHYFQRNNPDWQLVPIDSQLATKCAARFRSWNDLLHPGDPELALEAIGVEQALAHLDELGLSSAALLVQGEPIAFTFGEELNPDTFCVHVEKADSRFRGAYQAINHLFVKEYCQGYTYINRAEDMGSPGQRRAKESYHPCRFEITYSLREKP